jgi:membrane associated rhomboid family serine protease
MSKDNLYIFEMLNTYFRARHFQSIPTDIKNVSMFATQQKSNLYLINIIALNNEYVFDINRYEQYRHTTKLQFAKVPSDKIILLNIMITKEPDLVYEHVNYTPNLEDDFVDVHWIIDSQNKSLIIPSKQLKTVLGLEKSIKTMITTGMEAFYELTKVSKHSYLSLFLILVNVAVWVMLEYRGGSTNSSTLISYGAMNTILIQSTHQYWRFFSAMFLHIGFTHLAYNVFALYIFGSRLEKYINAKKYLFIYLFSGLLGSLVSYFGSVFMGTSVTSAGASGAIYGLLGAILILSKASGQSVDGLSSYMMWLIFISGIVFSVVSPSVDAFAHIGGFIGGIIASIPIVMFEKRQLGGPADEER